MRITHRMPTRHNRRKGCRSGCCVPYHKQNAARRTRRAERAELRRYIAEVTR